MNALALSSSFAFDGAPVRIIEQDGAPWFVAADVCNVIGIANSRDAIARLDADEKGVGSTDTLGGRQNFAIINESGLYALILRCRDAMTPGTAPYRFRKWVTAEVLPALRRDGAFGARPASDDDLRDLIVTLTAKMGALEKRVARLNPKARAFDAVAGEGRTLDAAAVALDRLAGLARAAATPAMPAPALRLATPDGPKLRRSEQAVLDAHRSAAKGDKSHLSVADIVRLTGYNERSVAVAHRRLAQMGLLRRDLPARGGFAVTVLL